MPKVSRRKLDAAERAVKYAALEREYHRRLRDDYHLAADYFNGVELDLAAIEAGLRTSGPSLAQTEAQAARDCSVVTDTFRGFPNAMWRAMLKDLLDGLRSSGFAQDIAQIVIYVAQVPDSSFNACSIAFEPDAWLILVNSGLMQFLNRLARIIIGSYPYSTDCGLQAEISLECAERLSKSAYDLLFVRGKEFYVSLRNEKLIRGAMTLLHALECAVLAHELGHIIAHHRPPIKRYLGRSRGGAARQAELIADAISDSACDLAVPIVARRFGLDAEYVGLYFFGGQRLLYHILAAGELVALSKHVVPCGPHPPATQRGIQLIRLHQRFGVQQALLEFALTLCSHFDAITARWADQIAAGNVPT